MMVKGKEIVMVVMVVVREYYKSYPVTSFNSLSYWVELVLWYDIRALMTNDHEFESHNPYLFDKN